jgi:hypothetical protein
MLLKLGALDGKGICSPVFSVVFMYLVMYLYIASHWPVYCTLLFGQFLHNCFRIATAALRRLC